MKALQVFLGLLVVSAVTVLADEPKLEDFATAGKLTKRDIIRYLLQKENPDLNMVGAPDTKLNDPVLRKLVLHAATTFEGYEFPPKDAYTIQEVKARLNIPDASGHLPSPTDKQHFPRIQGVFLREKWQDLKTGDVGDAGQEIAPASKGKPATFALTRNYQTDKTDWTVHGALFTSILLNPDFTLVPSVSLDEVSSPNPTNAVDSLVFRGAGQYELGGYSLIRGGALYATDTSFRSDQVGGELEYEFVDADLGIGAFKGIGFLDKRLLYRGRIFIHAEAGDVLDPGQNPNLKDGGFFRIGPLAQVELKTGFDPNNPFGNALNHLVLTARVQDYEAAVSGTKSTRLLTAMASYLIGDNGNVSINLAYRNGRQPLSAQKQNTLELSLGLMF
jgi:hypothetical protein